MGSYLPHSRLTGLQTELLEGFFAREQRFFLTGDGALAGFYLGHRTTEDLDLFAAPGPDLEDAVHAIDEVARRQGGTARSLRSFAEFKRLVVTRGDETCIVDLVIDRTPAIEPTRTVFGNIRVDPLREITANKICTLVGRSEIKDLVDLSELMRTGADLQQALADAERKDAGAEPVVLAWVLDQLAIGPEARLPGGVQPATLLAFRNELVTRLRAIAFEQAHPAR